MNQLLDMQTINGLKEILDDEFVELYVLFKSNSKLNIDKLISAGKENDQVTIKQVAHTMKGSFGNLGLSALFENMVNIENCLSNDEDADLDSLILNVEPLYHDTVQALIENGILTE
ncbi:MAG: Hpt domain-containing protein [Gammaproteobacteria bacterium]|nr:Hpt domain-containing protein [Gammaproteobacteria bacterium]